MCTIHPLGDNFEVIEKANEMVEKYYLEYKLFRSAETSNGIYHYFIKVECSDGNITESEVVSDVPQCEHCLRKIFRIISQNQVFPSTVRDIISDVVQTI